MPTGREIARRLRAAARAARTAAPTPVAGPSITLDYPFTPMARWGFGTPPHPELDALIGAGRERYHATLTSFLPHVDALAAIPLDGDGIEPGWANGWFGGLDAAALYCFLAQRAPATYVEVGAGNSTRFARRAITDQALTTRIVSIDPTPRASLEGLSDEHHTTPLEQTDLAVFDAITANDVVVLDGSHRTFTGSDVTVFFLEVLPRLPSGVLVYVDDVFLPWDYPPQIADRWYSEQYLLASWLLAGDRLEVTLPGFWVTRDAELHHILTPLWQSLTWAGVAINGTGFWFTVR